MGKENLPFRGAPGSLLPQLLDAAPEGILMVDFDLKLLLFRWAWRWHSCFG